MSNHQYTVEEFDKILEKLLPCDSKACYESTLAQITKEHFDGRILEDVRDGDPLNRLLWGRAIGAVRYFPSGIPRVRRIGPLTYVESLVVLWADKSISEERGRAQVSVLLNRSVGEIEIHRRKRQSGLFFK